MGTRIEKCKWCKARLVVPQDFQTITCTRCGVVAHLPPRNNGVLPSFMMNGGAGGGVFNGLPRSASMVHGLPRTASMMGGGFGNAIKQGVTNFHRAQTFIRSQLAPPNAFGPKRAVLCGITYNGHPKALKGSINDVMSMHNLLITKLGFPPGSILLLTEEEIEPTKIPTKMNIRRALSWLVQNCQAGDSLVFHYSGHGSRVKDQHGDEIDGHDECLCPVDYETEGRILDDEINSTIVRPLTNGVTLHAIIDTCHSGTFLDLPYMCSVHREGFYKWEDHRVATSTIYKGTQGGLAVCFSACDDHQTSGDTTAFTRTPNGALTYSFVKTLAIDQKPTYGGLLIAMRRKIYEAQMAIGHWGPFQEPQLTTSDVFDIHLKKCTI